MTQAVQTYACLRSSAVRASTAGRAPFLLATPTASTGALDAAALVERLPVRGAGELLAVAADCARRSGARGAIAEVTATAGRGGASRVVKEAKALREVLAGSARGRYPGAF